MSAIAQLIDADRLAFQVAPDNRVEPGKLIAFLGLLLCYALWIWVPAQLIAVCGRILLAGFGQRQRKADETAAKS